MPTIVQALGLQSSSRAPLELRHSVLREQEAATGPLLSDLLVACS